MNEPNQVEKKINLSRTIVLMTFVFWFIMMAFQSIINDDRDIMKHIAWSIILFGYGPIISLMFSLLFTFLLKKRGHKVATIVSFTSFLLFFVLVFFNKILEFINSYS